VPREAVFAVQLVTRTAALAPGHVVETYRRTGADARVRRLFTGSTRRRFGDGGGGGCRGDGGVAAKVLAVVDGLGRLFTVLGRRQGSVVTVVGRETRFGRRFRLGDVGGAAGDGGALTAGDFLRVVAARIRFVLLGAARVVFGRCRPDNIIYNTI